MSQNTEEGDDIDHKEEDEGDEENEEESFTLKAETWSKSSSIDESDHDGK